MSLSHLTGRKCNINLFAFNACVKHSCLDFFLLLAFQFFNFISDLVSQCAHLRSFFRAQILHRTQNRSKAAFLPKKSHSGFVKLLFIHSRSNSGSGFLFHKRKIRSHKFHNLLMKLICNFRQRFLLFFFHLFYFAKNSGHLATHFCCHITAFDLIFNVIKYGRSFCLPFLKILIFHYLTLL